jgi:hypothetical protein
MDDEQRQPWRRLRERGRENAFLKSVNTNTAVVINVTVPVTSGQTASLLGFPAFRRKLAKGDKKCATWHDHLERMEVLDGDLVFLHRQSRHMADGMRSVSLHLPRKHRTYVRSRCSEGQI